MKSRSNFSLIIEKFLFKCGAGYLFCTSESDCTQLWWHLPTDLAKYFIDSNRDFIKELKILVL